MIEPLRMSFFVDCPVEHAFHVWTAETSRWWPVTHTVTAKTGLEVVFEAGASARLTEACLALSSGSVETLPDASTFTMRGMASGPRPREPER